MGVNLKSFIVSRRITLSDLAGKKIVFDGFNMLYQFLTTIRTPSGELFSNKSGSVTSHLIGLFSRTTAFFVNDLRPVFVFDGEVPVLKSEERKHRAELKKKAYEKYEEAKKEKDIAAMRKYAARTSILTNEIIDDAKKLLGLFGIPIIQAPSEGEAQAAHMSRKNDCWAVASQDYDSLLHRAPRMIQNLSTTGKNPVLIDLKKTLESLKISQDQLIALAILLGTDYNPGGVKGIGPKKGFEIVKNSSDVSKIFSEFNINKDIFELIKNLPVTDDYELVWKSPDKKGIQDFLVCEKEFNEERVVKQLDRLPSEKQRGLSSFV